MLHNILAKYIFYKTNFLFEVAWFNLKPTWSINIEVRIFWWYMGNSQKKNDTDYNVLKDVSNFITWNRFILL